MFLLHVFCISSVVICMHIYNYYHFLVNLHSYLYIMTGTGNFFKTYLILHKCHYCCFLWINFYVMNVFNFNLLRLNLKYIYFRLHIVRFFSLSNLSSDWYRPFTFMVITNKQKLKSPGLCPLFSFT